MIWRVAKARPRQLRLMNENIRCSILFHLLVPGGKWQTLISSPVSRASCCNAIFHNLTRLPLCSRYYEKSKVAWTISRAEQIIRFRLDEGGAKVKVEATSVADPFAEPPPTLWRRCFYDRE